jgi:TonB family protein
MNEGRNRTDPRSPVQPGRLAPWHVIALPVMLFPIIWTASDEWFGAGSKFEANRDPPSALTQFREPVANASEPRPASGNLTGLFTANDYPREALRKEEQGTTAVRLDIDERGRIRTCTVLDSSGSASLDRATCNVLTRRARFSPALDSAGRAVADTHVQRISWRLQ